MGIQQNTGNEIFFPVILVQYVMPAGDELEINPHGNASSSQPYLRTSTSTSQTIKSKLKSASPKDKGGEFFAKSTGDLPCNRQQIYNINKHQKPLDPLYGLILEIQNLGGDKDQFIRELKLAPEPSMILAYDYKLEAFCTEPSYPSVLGIDPTFNLGQFHLTVTTHKQLQLVKPNGKHPTTLFLHYRFFIRFGRVKQKFVKHLCVWH